MATMGMMLLPNSSGSFQNTGAFYRRNVETSQEQPLDFSQKSSSSTSSEYVSANDSSPKSESATSPMNEEAAVRDTDPHSPSQYLPGNYPYQERDRPQSLQNPAGHQEMEKTQRIRSPSTTSNADMTLLQARSLAVSLQESQATMPHDVPQFQNHFSASNSDKHSTSVHSYRKMHPGNTLEKPIVTGEFTPLASASVSSVPSGGHLNLRNSPVSPTEHQTFHSKNAVQPLESNVRMAQGDQPSALIGMQNGAYGLQQMELCRPPFSSITNGAMLPTAEPNTNIPPYLSYPYHLLNSSPSIRPYQPMELSSINKKMTKNQRPFKAIENDLLRPKPYPLVTPYFQHASLMQEAIPKTMAELSPTTSTNQTSSDPAKAIVDAQMQSCNTMSSDHVAKSVVDQPEVQSSNVVSSGATTPVPNGNSRATPSPDSQNKSYADSSNDSFNGQCNQNQQLVQCHGGLVRRKGSRVPDHLKDENYRLRRDKNNAAAKRSRDNRRRKEDELALLAQVLKTDNDALQLQLRFAAETKRNLEETCRVYQQQLFNLESMYRKSQVKFQRQKKICRDCRKCQCNEPSEHSEDSDQ